MLCSAEPGGQARKVSRVIATTKPLLSANVQLCTEKFDFPQFTLSMLNRTQDVVKSLTIILKAIVL